MESKQLLVFIAIGVFIILALVFGFIVFGSLNYFGAIDIPGLPTGSSNTQVLFIGEPSLEEKIVFDNLSSWVTYRVRNADTFGNDATEELSLYDIIILDQSNSASKAVTVSLGEAIKKYVENGGKLIVVLNSGIYQSTGINDEVYPDVVGWSATFGKIIPAECVVGADRSPTCAVGKELNVIGRINRQDFDHPIMEGIEVSPTISDPPYSLMTLNIQSSEGARTIAYIKAENTPQTFPAILEKKTLIGDVIYFNYDPGLTPGILVNTIQYLK